VHVERRDRELQDLPEMGGQRLVIQRAQVNGPQPGDPGGELQAEVRPLLEVGVEVLRTDRGGGPLGSLAEQVRWRSYTFHPARGNEAGIGPTADVPVLQGLEERAQLREGLPEILGEDRQSATKPRRERLRAMGGLPAPGPGRDLN